jgi:hypothetical protein
MKVLGDTLYPQVTPPSPDAAALGKYGQYPVAMYNGLVQIDIPIYTIKMPLLSLPISLSYHASGIKIDEISTTVGLGWVLNSGGVITRSVRGMPDDNFGLNGLIQGKQWVIDNFTWKNNDMKNNYLFWRYKMEITGGYDSESDAYYYNVCGLTGSFRIDKDGNLIQIPLSNDKIELLSGDRFQITSSDGTVYIFADKEKSNHYYGPLYSSCEYTSSWYLTGITTTDNREISFDYMEDETTYTEHYPSFSLAIPLEPPYLGILTQNIPYMQTNQTLLPRSVTFPGGSVWFNYTGDRADRRKYRLTSIDIKDKTGLVKAFSLEQGYFTPTRIAQPGELQCSENYSSNFDYRLKLDKLILLDNQRTPISNYNFDYNSSALLPSYFNYSKYQDPYQIGNVYPYFGQDYWGYYNGVRTNKNSFVYDKMRTIYNINIPQADRSANPIYAQACILKKITYPTGGYTEFEYEGNKSQIIENAGGLRIKTVTSYSLENPNPVVHSYQYENGTDSYTQHKRP